MDAQRSRHEEVIEHSPTKQRKTYISKAEKINFRDMNLEPTWGNGEVFSHMLTEAHFLLFLFSKQRYHMMQ